MDSFGSVDAIKEPRGFIRILQLIFVICAFATTCNFSGDINISAKCLNNQTVSGNIPVFYPFSFSNGSNVAPICTRTNPMYGDFSASARFFVFVGVISFLYCIAMLLLYTVLRNHYDSSDQIKKADFLSSSFVVLLWFLASVVWASGVDQLKRYTTEYVISKEFCEGLPSCHVETLQTYAGLNISLVFGFANIALWASSLWFLWKETPWHQGNGSDLLEDSALPAVDGAPL